MRDNEAECVVQRMAEANFDRVRSINGFISGKGCLPAGVRGCWGL